MTIDLAALNALLNGRGIQGFGQQPAAAPAVAPAAPKKMNFLQALIEMARKRQGLGQPAATPAPAPLPTPMPLPAPTTPQSPRAAPKPFASQFDWSKFINTGDG